MQIHTQLLCQHRFEHHRTVPWKERDPRRAHATELAVWPMKTLRGGAANFATRAPARFQTTLSCGRPGIRGGCHRSAGPLEATDWTGGVRCYQWNQSASGAGSALHGCRQRESSRQLHRDHAVALVVIVNVLRRVATFAAAKRLLAEVRRSRGRLINLKPPYGTG